MYAPTCGDGRVPQGNAGSVAGAEQMDRESLAHIHGMVRRRLLLRPSP
jgi:hypothetical protein